VKIIPKCLVIAGTHSGVGKTTITLGIMAALKGRGFLIQPFKVGPDFIDPGYHEFICKEPSRNLDGWMLSKSYNLEIFHKHSRDKDLALVEGVMGLYDGARTDKENGSTAQIAKWLKAPVILVVDVRGMSRSVAALVYGYEQYDTGLPIGGIILNRVGSYKHFNWLKEVIEDKCRAPVIGYFPRELDISIPERHLGLVTSKENRLGKRYIRTLTNLVEKSINLDLLLKQASPIDSKTHRAKTIKISPPNHKKKHKVRIGVALDEAFCFYYRDNLDLIKHCGAQLIYFSPLRETNLPKDLDGLYLGGGYPELFAFRLEANSLMRKKVKQFALAGGVIYAECGGLMYLGKKLKQSDNKTRKMVNVFPYTTIMDTRLRSLGYFTVRVRKNNILANRGDEVRGHQFRYSHLEGIPDLCNRAFSLKKDSTTKSKTEGFVFKNVLATYMHLHFGSSPGFAGGFVESCAKNK
jgi:cobyrinic acid a,c-diamide synthase